MEYKWCVLLLTILPFILVLVNGKQVAVNDPTKPNIPKPCPNPIVYNRGTNCFGCNRNRKQDCCVEGAVTDYFQNEQFENIFSNRDSVEAHAKGFWDYHSFITASAEYQSYGFGTTYMNLTFLGTKEVAAFLAHVGSKTSCEYLCLPGNFHLGFCLLWNWNWILMFQIFFEV